MIRRSIFLAALLLLAVRPAGAADPPIVVVSIKPLHGLASAVMAGVGAPQLLIPGGASPHRYSLKPSQARQLAAARLVIRVGPALEGFLDRPLKTLAGQARHLDLADAAGITHRRASAQLDGHGAHAHDHKHEHDDHDGRDMHLWLDPANARAMAAAIAAALAEVDPANAARYRRNGAELTARLGDLDIELATTLRQLGGRPYIVFHDAYRHLESRYGLQNAGVIAVNPDRPPGAQRIREIRRRVTAGKIRCVFSEPQFPPRLGQTVTSGTEVRTAILDPIGAEIEPGPAAYFRIMRGLAASFAACLS